MKFQNWPQENPRHGAVVLREFRATDATMVCDLSRDEYCSLLGDFPAAADERQARMWLRSQGRRFLPMIGFSFAIADARTDEALGQLKLWPMEAGRAQIAYLLAPFARGRGHARDAVVAGTRLAFDQPEVHRVEGYVEPWNTASIRTLDGAGYTREGLIRERDLIGDRLRDLLLFSRLRSEGPIQPVDA